MNKIEANIETSLPAVTLETKMEHSDMPELVVNSCVLTN
jgi:hypothetical protein